MDSPSASSVTSLPSYFPSFVSSSTTATPNSANKRNFWDFEAYSRHFLHERKLIEREVSASVQLKEDIVISFLERRLESSSEEERRAAGNVILPV